MKCTKLAIVSLGTLSFLFAALPASANLIGLNWTTAASVTPDPQNWTRVSAPDGTISNLPDETGAVTGASINFGGDAAGGFVYLSTATLAADAVPQYMYDLSGMTGYGFRSNGVFFAEFRGLTPNLPYEYWFVAYRATTTIQQIVKVSDGDTIDAFEFTQSMTAAQNNGRFVVNTAISSNTQQWNDLAFLTNSSSTGTIRFNWQGDGQTTVIGALAIRAIPEPATIVALGTGLAFLIRRRKKTA